MILILIKIPREISIDRAGLVIGSIYCDVTKGRHVVQLEVTHGGGSEVTLTAMTLSGFKYIEFQFYVGSKNLPRDVLDDCIVAPGH